MRRLALLISLPLVLITAWTAAESGPRPAFSAKGTNEAGYLFWGTGDGGELWRGRADGILRTRVIEKTEIEAMVADFGAGKMYRLLDVGLESYRIERANFDGTDVEILVGNRPGVRGDLELDLPGQKIYWTDQATDAVLRCNLDGSGIETVLTGLADIGFDLALDTDSDRLYLVFDSNRKILRADFDGSNVTEIYDTGGGNNLGWIAIDTANDRLYYTESSNLYRALLDGSMPQLIRNPTSAAGLLVRGSSLYFLEDGVDGPFLRTDLDGTNADTLVNFPSNGAFSRFEVDVANDDVYFFHEDHFLARADLVTDEIVALETRVGDDVHDVAVDATQESLFFVPWDTHQVFSTNLDGGGLTALAYDSTAIEDDIRGVALDTSAGRLYFVSINGTAQAIDIDGTDLVTLTSALTFPHDIALDVANGHLYVTDNIESSGTGGAIRRLDMAGGPPVDILTDLDRRIRGIDLDPVAGKLYWTDQGAGTISRADVTGANVEIVVSGLDRPHDVAIDPVGGRIYWTEGINEVEENTGSIRSANLDGTDVQDVFTGLLDNVRDLTFVQWDDGLVFYDGFESGDVGSWSTQVP